MPDVHDAALEWAQSNPTDPRAQDVMAKAWASKNPTDPRSAKIMEKLNPSPEPLAVGARGDSQALRKFATSDEGRTVGENAANVASFGYLPQAEGGVRTGVDKLKELFGAKPGPGYTANRDAVIDRMSQDEQQNPFSANAGKALGATATALVPGGAVSNLSKGAKLGKTLIAGGIQGGVTAGLYNPGDEKGVVHNPLEGDIQAGDRAKNATVGAAVGVGLAGTGYALQKGAELSGMIDKVEHPEVLGPEVKGQIRDASDKLTKDYIAPRAEQVKSLIAGKHVEISPDVYSTAGQSLTEYAKTLPPPERREVMETVKQLVRVSKDAVENGEKVQIPAELAQEMKKHLYGAANFYKAGIESPAIAAANKNAQWAAGELKNSIHALDPGIKTLDDEMGKAIAYRDGLKGNKNPISALTTTRSPADLVKQGELNVIDKLTGSKLAETGEQIKKANELVKGTNIESLFHPLQKLNQAIRYGERAALPLTKVGAKVINPAANQSTQMGLSEALRNK